VDLVDVDSVQQLLPIAFQQAAQIFAARNIRFINCWLGIATKEVIGSTFCVECEYLGKCLELYKFFDGSAELHPAARARDIIKRFNIESDYYEE